MKRRAAAAAVGFIATTALGAEPEWETVVEGPPFVVKTRDREGSPIKEIWAEGNVEASALDLQSALMEPGRFSRFMPSVKSARELGQVEPDGSFYVYTQLDLPVIQARDYAVRIWVDEAVRADGTGAFRQRWTAASDKMPEASGYVRVKVNDGSWHITPVAGGAKSHVVYRFSTDPGGLIPGWAKNAGNKKASVDVIKAVELEAQRRAAERARAAVPPAGAAVAAPGSK